MPTGYTAPVADGKITEFADFALTCARGFGALVLLRDSDQSLEATKRYIAEEAYLAGDGGYYARELESQKERVFRLRTLSDADALAEAIAEREEVRADNERSERERAETEDRYQAMLAKVAAWEPPTDDHWSFKEYMEEQLADSIKFDCSPFSMPVPEVTTGAAWREAKIIEGERRIARLEDDLAKERERETSRKAWVEALVESLAVPVQP